MRLSREQSELASIMIWAIENNYFNYGDRVEYLPKSDRFKVVCADLDKPFYCRFGAFYHDWLKLDRATQQEIYEAHNEEKDHYKICLNESVISVAFKSFVCAYRVVSRVNKKTTGNKWEIAFYHHTTGDNYESRADVLKARGIEL